MSFVDDSGQPAPTEPAGGPANEPALSGYAQNFLSGIADEAEKTILTKYLPQWDSGFTKQVQQHTNVVNQYKKYGSPDDFQQSMALLNQLRSDPASVVKLLMEEGLYTPEVPREPDPNEFKLPPELEQKLGKLDQIERATNNLAQYWQQQQQAQKQAEEDAQLEAAVSDLQKKYGDFDQNAVFSIALSNGGDLEGAVKQWNSMIQAAINKRSASPAPPVMGATSLPPLQKKASEMSTEERKSALTTFISQLGNG